VLSLTYLLDIFKDAFCSKKIGEIAHDKVYAFLGLAHDCSGDNFPVDYHKTASEVYQDLIRFYWMESTLTPKQRSIELMYYSALCRRLLTRESGERPRPQREIGRLPIEYDLLTTIPMSDPKLNKDYPMTVDGLGFLLYKLVVLTLISLWRYFQTSPEERHWKASDAEMFAEWEAKDVGPNDFDNLLLRGVVVGRVRHIGPSYKHVISHGVAAEEWRAGLRDHLTTLNDREKVEGLNDRLVATLKQCTDFSTLHIESFQEPSPPQRGSDRASSAGTEPSQSLPRAFLGTDMLVGVLPANAREGDAICQFWKSNACAVIREKEHVDWILSDFDNWAVYYHLQKNTSGHYEVIGRAAIVSSDHVGWDVRTDLGGELFSVVNEKAVDVPISLRDLTRLSLDTVNLPAT
jgi:hypothetical protein